MSKKKSLPKEKKVDSVEQEGPKVEEVVQNSSPDVRPGSFAELLSRVNQA